MAFNPSANEELSEASAREYNSCFLLLLRRIKLLRRPGLLRRPAGGAGVESLRAGELGAGMACFGDVGCDFFDFFFLVLILLRLIDGFVELVLLRLTIILLRLMGFGFVVGFVVGCVELVLLLRRMARLRLPEAGFLVGFVEFVLLLLTTNLLRLMGVGLVVGFIVGFAVGLVVGFVLLLLATRRFDFLDLILLRLIGEGVVELVRRLLATPLLRLIKLLRRPGVVGADTFVVVKSVDVRLLVVVVLVVLVVLVVVMMVVIVVVVLVVLVVVVAVVEVVVLVVVVLVLAMLVVLIVVVLVVVVVLAVVMVLVLVVALVVVEVITRVVVLGKVLVEVVVARLLVVVVGGFVKLFFRLGGAGIGAGAKSRFGSAPSTNISMLPLGRGIVPAGTKPGHGLACTVHGSGDCEFECISFM